MQAEEIFALGLGLTPPWKEGGVDGEFYREYGSAGILNG
jgi:hypothetical protein